ncbi:MAG: isoprenoid biosynthesis glyoxalase ElbB [Candidatus Krumholzibacteriia bacterium]
MKRVAVILCGCGVKDGSEIHEAVATLLALDRAGAEALVFAPRGPQHDVIDHLTGRPQPGQTRDMLVEAARIARGRIRDLAELQPADIDALILPGGFGAAKNLCSFADEGAACTVHPEVARVLSAAHRARKPIGALCIAPVIVARVLGATTHARLTIGNDPATAAALEQMGARHVEAPVTAAIVDETNRLVTTPCYMLAGRIGEVFDGAAALVRELLALC